MSTWRSSPEELLALCRGADLVYLDERECTEGLERAGFTAVECLFGTDIELVVCRLGEDQVVLVRGTEPTNLSDWLVDARLIRRSWGQFRPGPGAVHHGFADAGDSVFWPVRRRLSPDRALLFGGHSLGGALETYLAGMLLWSEPGAWNIRGLSIGSPRVGNAVYAEWLSSMLGEAWVRAVHNNDVVTRIPTRLQGYRHVGRTVAWIEHDGDIVWDPGPWQRFQDRVVGRIESLLGPDVREVPGVEGGVYALLDRAGYTIVARLLEPVAMSALIGLGVPAPLASRLVDWAADRTHGGTLLDGVADHGRAGYVRAFERLVAEQAANLG